MLSRKLSLLNLFKVSSIVGLSVCANNAMAVGSVGVGIGGFGESEYREYDSDVSAFPSVNMSNDIFFIKGLSAGAYLFDDSITQLSASVTYYAKEYDASDSDNASMQLLDDRDSTATFDITSRVRFNQMSSVALKASYDILDESNGGYLLDASYSLRLPIIPEVIVVSSSAGVTWYNDKFTQHYYGISAKESTASGLSQYTPDDSFLPYISLGVNFNITQSFGVFLNGKYTFLDDEVTDSPMVENDEIISGMIGLNYNF